MLSAKSCAGCKALLLLQYERLLHYTANMTLPYVLESSALAFPTPFALQDVNIMPIIMLFIMAGILLKKDNKEREAEAEALITVRSLMDLGISGSRAVSVHVLCIISWRKLAS